MKDITPIRLAKWLAQQENSAIVGRTHAPTCCPLASCLKALNDSDYASVGGRVHTIGLGYGTNVHIDNKPWQRDFIHLVDWLNRGIVQSPVSAGEAKDILVRVTPRRYQTQVQRILGLIY